MIFAKDDNHATEIVDIAKNVFKPEFENDAIPEKFVQKITYSVGDSNALIRDLRTEKDFRIAVTVTLVATGTDVKPLEVVLFMKDVHSDVLYTQMKGRGCRVISDDKLKEVTPNADTKECYKTFIMSLLVPFNSRFLSLYSFNNFTEPCKSFAYSLYAYKISSII